VAGPDRPHLPSISPRLTDVTVDPFTRVMGPGRGSEHIRSRGVAAAVHWWHGPHEELSEWLDRMFAKGHVEYSVYQCPVSNLFLLWAYPGGRGSWQIAYVSRELARDEEQWLEQHWPPELVQETASTRYKDGCCMGGS
jgi:hypothetical protein